MQKCEYLVSAALLIRLIATALVLSYLLSLRKGHRISAQGWEGLISQLNPVQLSSLRGIALGRHMSQAQVDETFATLYKSIGGGEGVKRMRENANVLISLAAYTEVWSPGVSIEAIRKMRADGFRLRRAATKIALIEIFRLPGGRDCAAVRDLSESYCNMVDHLLGLYMIAHISRHQLLRAACGG